MKINIHKNVFNTNEEYASEVKKILKKYNIKTFNLLSSPGAGKTTLLEETLKLLKDEYKCIVIEGDLATDIDRQRISQVGVESYQINTVKGCHLNAKMIYELLNDIVLNDIDFIFIENVGNLVCPAEYNLGEDHKIVILSTPEGDEKPLKYPVVFRNSDVCIINKTDLVKFVNFDIEKIKINLKKINPDLTTFFVSCYTKEGLNQWINWLKNNKEG
jgi:hydrogenase nickel incorporation protein HypB